MAPGGAGAVPLAAFGAAAAADAQATGHQLEAKGIGPGKFVSAPASIFGIPWAEDKYGKTHYKSKREYGTVRCAKPLPDGKTASLRHTSYT